MTEHRLTSPQIQAFAQHLLLEEKSAATIENISGTSMPSPAGWMGEKSVRS